MTRQLLMRVRAGGRCARILIVNRDSSMATSLQNALPKNFECMAARSGLIALDMIQSYRPHLVIIDTQVSDILYDALSSQMRCSKYMDGVPIIALSSKGGLLEKYRCINAGIDDYIHTPVSGQELRDHVISALAPQL